MAANTKQALADAFKRLLSQRSMDKITVKDIVEECGVNRQTFYYHFHDIYALLEWIFQDTADSLLAESRDYGDWSAGVESLLNYLRRDKALVLNAYNSVNHDVVNRYLKRLLRPYVMQTVSLQGETLEHPPRKEDVEFVTDLYTLTAAGLIMEWIGQQMKMQGVEERLRKFYTAIHGSVRFVLENLADNQE